MNTPLLPLLLGATAFTGGLGMTALFAAITRQDAAAPLLNRGIALTQWLLLALLAAWLVSGLAGLSPAAAEALPAVRGSAGWAMTFAWLLAATLLTLWIAHRRPHSLMLVALLAVHGAWAFRWILLMGGQAIPKMGSAFHAYSLTLKPDGRSASSAPPSCCSPSTSSSPASFRGMSRPRPEGVPHENQQT